MSTMRKTQEDILSEKGVIYRLKKFESALDKFNQAVDFYYNHRQQMLGKRTKGDDLLT